GLARLVALVDEHQVPALVSPLRPFGSIDDRPIGDSLLFAGRSTGIIAAAAAALALLTLTLALGESLGAALPLRTRLAGACALPLATLALGAKNLAVGINGRRIVGLGARRRKQRLPFVQARPRAIFQAIGGARD